MGISKKKTTELRCNIVLPKPFRPSDVLSFHQRDSQMVAERVEAATLHKGLLWDGYPACLTIHFDSDLATAELFIDGAVADDGETLSRMVRRMLGLTQHIEKFEKIYRDNLQIGPLIAGNPGLRVPVTATPFEALTWAIAGQQITRTGEDGRGRTKLTQRMYLEIKFRNGVFQT